MTFETAGPIDPDTGRFKGVPEPEVTEELEAAGQEAFVASITLPIEIQGKFLDDKRRLQTPEEAEADFEALGIILGKPIDKTFRNAILPTGWEKVPSDHSMWSHIVDDSGKERVAIFFKAAPYDYHAFMRITEEGTP